MPKPVSKELLDFLESAPKITRRVIARYDPASGTTRAVVTYTANGEIFTQAVGIGYGPIVDLSDVWIGDVHIPKEDIVFEKPIVEV